MKPKDKRYLVADGGGLVLEVMTSGARIWRYRYSLNGKPQPLVTIVACWMRATGRASTRIGF